METTPPLPATGGPRPDIHAGQHTSHAHRLCLYGALDRVCVPLTAADVQAVFQLAELDCPAVHTVIDWISRAQTLPPLTHPT